MDVTPWPYPGNVVYAWHVELSTLGTGNVPFEDVLSVFKVAEANEWIGFGGGVLISDTNYIPELSILFPIDEKDL